MLVVEYYQTFMPCYYPRRLLPSLFLVRVRIIKYCVVLLDLEGLGLVVWLFPTLLIKLFISVHPLLEGYIGLDYTHETKQDFIKSAHFIKDKQCVVCIVLFSFRGGVVVGYIVEVEE